MSANLEAKKMIVKEIQEKIENSKSIVLSDYQGLNVAEVTELREEFREAGVDFKVYKNNLVKLAIQDTEYESLKEDLVGPNALAFSYEDPVISASIINDFSKDHENLSLKTGIVEGEYCDIEKMAKIASIPSKDELVVKFLGSVKSSVNNFVYLLSNIADEKEEA